MTPDFHLGLNLANIAKCLLYGIAAIGGLSLLVLFLRARANAAND
jgi:hypothetical protein